MNIIGYEIKHNLSEKERDALKAIISNDGSCSGLRTCGSCALGYNFPNTCLPRKYSKAIGKALSISSREYKDIKIMLAKKILNYREHIQEELEI